jgi:hypothetical protein
MNQVLAGSPNQHVADLLEMLQVSTNSYIFTAIHTKYALLCIVETNFEQRGECFQPNLILQVLQGMALIIK